MLKSKKLSVWLITKKYILQYKINFIIYIILSSISTIIFIFIPQLLKYIIDKGIIKHDKNEIFLYGVSIAVSFIICSLLSFFSSYISAKIVTKAYIKFDFDIISHIQSLPINFFEKTDTVYLSTRLNDDTEEIISFILHNMTMVIINIFIILSINIILLAQCGCLLFLIFVLCIVIDIISYFIYRKGIYKITYEKKELGNHFFSFINSQLSQIKFIKINSISEFMKNNSKNLYEKYVINLIKFTKINTSYVLIGKLFRNVAICLLLVIGGLLVINNLLTLGILLASVAYFDIGFKVVDDLHSFAKDYQNILVSINRINNLLSVEVEKFGTLKIREIDSLTFDNISFSYGEKEIIKNITFIFKKGEINVIRGQNGKGKTTILELIAGLRKPTTGTILINSHNLNDIDILDYRKHFLAYMEQSPIMLDINIKENILLGNKCPDSIINNIANKLFVYDKYKSLFLSGDRLGSDSVALSGGEKQKFCFLRCWLKDAPLVVLDEPTSSQDNTSVENMKKIIKEMSNDKIVIIITHDKRLSFDKERVLNL